MADHEQENSHELLTEREKEAIQELARAIVREASLAPDPEAEAAKAKAEAEEKRKEDYMVALRRNMDAQVEFYKHMTTLSGASVAVAVAVYGAFLKDAEKPIVLAYFLCLGAIGVSMMLAGLGFGRISGKVGQNTLQGNFFRDKKLAELVEQRRSPETWALRLVQRNNPVTLIWYLGVYGCSIVVLVAYLANP